MSLASPPSLIRDQKHQIDRGVHVGMNNLALPASAPARGGNSKTRQSRQDRRWILPRSFHVGSPGGNNLLRWQIEQGRAGGTTRPGSR
jgi:hypothetical protein